MMIGQFRAIGDWGFWGLVWGKNFLWGHSWTDILYPPPKPNPLLHFTNFLFFMIGNTPQSQIFYFL